MMKNRPDLFEGILNMVQHKSYLMLAAAILFSIASSTALASELGISGNDGAWDGAANTTCSLCHTGTSYTASNPTFTGSTSVAVGSTNAYSVRLTDGPAATLNGFSATVRKAGVVTRYGAFSTGDADVQTGTAVSANDYVTHTGAVARNSTFSFNWTAPTTPTTGLLLYACINQVSYTGSVLDDDTTNDGPPKCGTRSITVTNTVPVTVNDTRLTNANLDVGENDGASATFNVLTNDNDGDAGATQTLSVQSINTAATTGAIAGTAPNYTYNPNGQFESLAAGVTTTDSFTYTLSDGYDTDVGTVTARITGVNDAPVVTNSGGAPDLAFTELDTATVIDNGLSVSDIDTADLLNRAEVTLTTNYAAGEDVLACGTVAAGITCSYVAPTLTLTSATTNTIAQYQAALRLVTYYNSSLNPTVNTRTITYRVRDDSNAYSATDTATVSVAAISTPPQIAADYTGTAAFTENGFVVVDNAITLSDSDSTLLNQAVMTLTTNNVPAEDVLACNVAVTGITCSYTAPTLTLTSGTTNTLAQYETAIEGIRYTNSSDDPSTSTRTVTLTVRDNSNTSSSTSSKSISITPVNDPPVIGSTAPATVYVEETATYSYQITQSGPEAADTFTYSLGGTGLAGDTGAGDMAISGTGLISWTPPRTGVFNDVSATVTVTVTDSDSSTAGVDKLTDMQMFTVTTSPLDTDADGVADYSDNCPATGPASQADNDADTQYTAVDVSGIPATGDVDPTDPATGGDTCDTDDDNDGMPDIFEATYGFDPFDAADATTDFDGDGVSNLQEFLDGTDPIVDTVGPSLTLPADVTVNATGFLTVVDIGVATVNDGNEGVISSVVAGVDIVAADLDTCAELTNYSSTIDALRPGAHVVTWASCDSSDNFSSATQNVTVIPLLNTTTGQTTGEGRTISVDVMLNGPAAAYPVTVDYALSGTATAVDDFNVVAGTGTITIAAGADVDGNDPGVIGRLDINIVADFINGEIEDIVLTLSNPVNAVLDITTEHSIIITDDNAEPLLELTVSQGGNPAGANVVNAGGVVNIVATADDPNGDAVTFDWTATDGTLFAAATISAPSAVSSSLDIAVPATGLYPVEVSVSDGTVTTTMTMLLNVIAAAPDPDDCDLDGSAVGSADIADCDGDGVINTTEGTGDSDGDGIADYLDSDIYPDNILQNQSGDAANSYPLETESGLVISLGTTALASGEAGALVSQDDIANNGGQAGGVGLLPEDDYINVGGLYDFEISGLSPDKETATVVIPLQTAILADAEYRKYDGTGWFTFVEDDNNSVKSAAGEPGVCPAPGSSEYTAGLTLFAYCIQLVIEDGGPNDADGVRDYVIRDPGGVGVPPESAAAVTSSDGRIGVVHPLMLLSILGIFVLLYRRSKVL